MESCLWQPVTECASVSFGSERCWLHTNNTHNVTRQPGYEHYIRRLCGRAYLTSLECQKFNPVHLSRVNFTKLFGKIDHRWILCATHISVKCSPYPLACPGMRQRAPISALIKPIGLCGTQNAQKKFLTRPTIFRPPPHRAEVLMADLLYGKFFFGVQTWSIAH